MRGTLGVVRAPPLRSARATPRVPDAVVARLRKFAAMSLFKKQARRVLASLLPEEEVAGLRNLFVEMDSDCDGRIAVPDLYEVWGLCVRVCLGALCMCEL